MKATANYTIKGFLLIAGVMIVLAVAVFVRAGPEVDPDLLPQMADRPVILPDGIALYVQRYEVSVTEWTACYRAGACALDLRVRPGAPMPATGLSYLDVTEYIAWINGATGVDFRLPTLPEWEFMAREVLPDAPDPIFTDPNLSWASAYLLEPQISRALRPQGAFQTTSEGVSDLDGNVWEWTQGCYTDAITRDRCPAFLVGGEHIAAIPFPVRDPARGGCAVGAPPAHLGMRLVTTDRVHRSEN